MAPGLVGGWTAGLAVLLVALVHSALAGTGFLWPLERFSTAVFGERIIEYGVVAPLAGLLVHFLTAGVWGVLFNALVPRGAPYGWAAVAGLLYGVFAYFVMTWLVLPLLLTDVFLVVHPLVLLGYHLLFGAILPIAIPIRRSLSGGAGMHTHRDQIAERRS